MQKKNIIITGASKGIGLAIAKAFAAEDVHLLICARSVDGLDLAKKEIISLNQHFGVDYFSADLGKKQEVQAFADWCLQKGAPYILVNNAGTFVPGDMLSSADGAMESMMNTNFYSVYYLTKALVPAMIEKGEGHIFNICSIAALQAYDGGGGYSISKFALDGFSKNLRYELKDKKIKVTTVYPGAVLTDSWAGFDNSSGRIMEAEDIASMVLAASKLSPQAVTEEIILRPQLGDL